MKAYGEGYQYSKSIKSARARPSVCVCWRVKSMLKIAQIKWPKWKLTPFSIFHKYFMSESIDFAKPKYCKQIDIALSKDRMIIFSTML